MSPATMINPRLIILSDLWGKSKVDWLKFYTNQLESAFTIEFYDCCKLGEIDIEDYTEKSLHQQFVNGGIERAVHNLLALEKSEVQLLAFSIGGTIAWKYGLKSGLIKKLTCVSSTRLRYESQRPSGDVTVYFGEEDSYKPPEPWMKSMTDNFILLPGKDHSVYQESSFSKMLCKQLLNPLG